jgi:hypothetical protein
MGKCPKCKDDMELKETPPKPENPTFYESYYYYWGEYWWCGDCGIVIKI